MSMRWLEVVELSEEDAKNNMLDEHERCGNSIEGVYLFVGERQLGSVLNFDDGFGWKVYDDRKLMKGEGWTCLQLGMKDQYEGQMVLLAYMAAQGELS